MDTKKALLNAGVLAVSIVLALAVCEVAARLALQPANYLSVEMVPHPVFGAVPSSNTLAGGFDEWGFRNPAVPKTADIVAIGDSHTYGNGVAMVDSWPAVLGGLTGRDVYNMGLGGYGPNQYFEIFNTKALSLTPRTIICGLYMGDDFENAFLITYGLDHWSYLRELPAESVNFDIWVEPPAPSWHKKIRVWLSRHSVTYQLLVHGPLLGPVQGEIQIKNTVRLNPDTATLLEIPDPQILEAFLPTEILRRLDQDSTSVREGMRITFRLLKEMDELSRQHHIQFVVTVIPTKEMVFAEYLEHKPELPLSSVVDRLLANERIARDKTFSFLTDAGISYVDTLPGLRRAVKQELYARLATDMHPNRNGYRVLAEEVFGASQQD